MQGTGDVRRGNYQRIGNAGIGRVGRKISLGDPETIPVFFYAFWVEAFV
jgi:hypothetical protein